MVFENRWLGVFVFFGLICLHLKALKFDFVRIGKSKTITK